MDKGIDQNESPPVEGNPDHEEVEQQACFYLASPTETNLAGDLPLVSLGARSMQVRRKMRDLSTSITRSNVEMIASTSHHVKRSAAAIEHTKATISHFRMRIRSQ